ncbi:MAG TPA: DUF4135 domain-containing protein [Pseudobdellovibrionaceae bacterium]|jgi:hypothetical protein
MSDIDADKHNFGQLVKPMERASSLYFRKPRPVFWEHLFFGKESPLESVFSEIGENGQVSLASLLFNLEIDVESEWLGYSKEIPRSNESVTDQHFYSFGVLLAYAYLFGIRDLHKFNLIKTKTHLQVIDAEVVLTNLILPNESVLLPFKDVPFNVCGLNLLVDSLVATISSQKQLIFAGYFDLFAVAFCKQRALLESLSVAASTAPIRIIIRNTKVYSNHLNGSSKILDLLSEEQAQLERGDIPYFFKRLGDNQLYWISSTDGNTSSVQSTDSFTTDVDRHAQQPSLLIGSPEVVEKKMAQGALFLQRKLGSSDSYEFSWNDGKLTLSPGEFKNTFTGSQFRVGKS